MPCNHICPRKETRNIGVEPEMRLVCACGKIKTKWLKTMLVSKIAWSKLTQ